MGESLTGRGVGETGILRRVLPMSAALLAMVCGCDVVRESAVARDTGVQSAVALVVGNGKYDAVADVTTAEADARVIARVLEELGFTVVLVLHASGSEMRDAMQWFVDRTTSGSDGLFYYSGHAAQFANRAYLMPSESDVETESRFQATTLELGPWAVFTDSSGRSNNRLFIVNASDEDPIAERPWSAYGAASGSTPGETLVPTGTVMAFSRAQGNESTFNDGPLSTYAEELLQTIRDDLPAEQMLDAVATTVVERTNGLQTPWYVGTTQGGFSLAGDRSHSHRGDELDVASGQSWHSVMDSVAKSTGVLQSGDAIYEAIPGPRGALDVTTRLWPNGTVPYVFDDGLDDARRRVFLEAARRWAAVAPVRFVPYTDEDDWIIVRPQNNPGGVATIGMGSFEPGHLSLGPDPSLGLVLHEMGHTLGMHHEHTRSDRDQYVEVDGGLNFRIRDETQNCTPYDFESIMHYRSVSSFGTVTPVASFAHFNDFIGRESDVTPTDVLDVRILYGTEMCPEQGRQAPFGDLDSRVAPVATIAHGASLVGELSESDPQWTTLRAYEVYEYPVSDRHLVTITMESENNDIDPYLLLFRDSLAGRNLVAKNDDGGQGLGRNSKVSLNLEAGVYLVVATTFRPGQRGRFLLAVHEGTGRNAHATLVPGASRMGWLTRGDSRWSTGSYLDKFYYRTPATSAATVTVTSQDFRPTIELRRDGQFVGDFGPDDSGTKAESPLTVGESHEYEVRVTVEGYRRGSADRGAYEVLVTERPLDRQRDERPRRPTADDELVEQLEMVVDGLDFPVRELRGRRTSRLSEDRDPYFDYEAITYEHWVVIGRRGEQALITMESDDVVPLLFVQQDVFDGRASGFDPMDWDYGRQGRRPACVNIRFPKTAIYSVLAADGIGGRDGRYEVQIQRHRGELDC